MSNEEGQNLDKPGRETTSLLRVLGLEENPDNVRKAEGVLKTARDCRVGFTYTYGSREMTLGEVGENGEWRDPKKIYLLSIYREAEGIAPAVKFEEDGSLVVQGDAVREGKRNPATLEVSSQRGVSLIRRGNFQILEYWPPQLARRLASSE